MKNDVLGIFVNRHRKMEGRVTNKNKDKLIKEINKHGKEVGFGKLDKNASLEQVRATRNLYLERLGYDILTLAVEEGNTTISSIYSKGLKKSDDKETRRLAEFAEKLAYAKKRSDMHLTNEQKKFLDEGNQSILGYGNENIIKEFENTKTRAQAEKLIKSIQSQNPKNIFYDKQIGTFENVFQKIEGVREDDLTKLKEHLSTLSFTDMKNETNYLIESLEVYGSPKQLGAWDDETELANARLDDILIKTGLKKGGHKKVKKTLEKYEHYNVLSKK